MKHSNEKSLTGENVLSGKLRYSIDAESRSGLKPVHLLFLWYAFTAAIGLIIKWLFS